jgi:signal peptidase I
MLSLPSWPPRLFFLIYLVVLTIWTTREVDCLVSLPIGISVVRTSSSSLFSNTGMREDERPLAQGQPRATKLLLNREWTSPKDIKDIRLELALHDRFVPVIGNKKTGMPFFARRQLLFDMGSYPGVEYRIRAIVSKSSSSSGGGDGNYTSYSSVREAMAATSRMEGEDISLVIRPAYPLIKELERDWPVEVKLADIPYCLSRGSYNVLTVLGSIGLAASFLASAGILASILTLSVINTRSMVPAILPKDVVLVEKLSPIINRLFGRGVSTEGDIVFFAPPVKMNDYISRNKLPPVGDSLIVKRVSKVEPSCITVLGDNPLVSLDSRQFGCLPRENVVGKPLFRLLPLKRIGFLEPLQVPTGEGL